MSFATNQDLVEYYPTAMDHGVGDWTEQLAQAQGDVETMIKSRWFNREFDTSSTRTRVAGGFPAFNPARLSPSQWTRATVFRALACYILPNLSTFRPEGDAFREQLNFFSGRSEEEFNLQLNAGVEYDTDDSGTISEGERFQVDTSRMYR